MHDFVDVSYITMPLSPLLLDELIAGTIRTLFLTGFLLLVVTLLQASFWEGYPLKQLGAYLFFTGPATRKKHCN